MQDTNGRRDGDDTTDSDSEHMRGNAIAITSIPYDNVPYDKCNAEPTQLTMVRLRTHRTGIAYKQ